MPVSRSSTRSADWRTLPSAATHRRPFENTSSPRPVWMNVGVRFSLKRTTVVSTPSMRSLPASSKSNRPTCFGWSTSSAIVGMLTVRRTLPRL